MPTIIDDLVSVIDEARGIHTDVGDRPYTLHRIKVQWSGTRLGMGTPTVLEDVEITPLPLVSDIGGLERMLQPVGSDEHGTLNVSEVSLRYTEADLVPTGLAANVNCFWEVRYATGVRRRFVMSGAPEYSVRKPIGWKFRITEQDGPRTSAGLAR